MAAPILPTAIELQWIENSWITWNTFRIWVLFLYIKSVCDVRISPEKSICRSKNYANPSSLFFFLSLFLVRSVKYAKIIIVDPILVMLNADFFAFFFVIDA